MILIFGGTTEGRLAAEVCEQAGSPFYYSTLGEHQQVPLVHGTRLSGNLTADGMRRFCHEHHIRLVVDASHPFAEGLHRHIAQTGLPVVRVQRDRIGTGPTAATPAHGVVRCTDFDDALHRLEAAAPRCLLALTGVNTIARLKPYWQRHDTRFRILHRAESIARATACGFPAQQLLFYADGAALPTAQQEQQLMQEVGCDAVITKESGTSGGLQAKVEAALALGLDIYVVAAPDYAWLFPPSATLRFVTGRHTLRRAIEQLLPGFFPLRTGLTTGTCATAAVKAALLGLMGHDEKAVDVALPDGETVQVGIDAVRVQRDGAWAEADVTKDFSDDPDVTRGCRITARVALGSKHTGSVRFLQGEGVGRVTLPGLGIAVGEPAINPVPRRMITAELHALTRADADITLAVEGGKALAERTFNNRVGVVDGISIIGSSGIVSPLSNEAFIQSISRELEVAKAIGCTSIGFASGKQGETALLAAEPSLHVVHYGNFIGQALSSAHALGFERAVLGIMVGKAVKLAEGHLDTHSHKVQMNKDFLASVARSAGVADADAKLAGVVMARELWGVMPKAFFQALQARCYEHCRTVFPTGQLEVRIIET